MKRLLILGAGGFGREILAWALDAQAAGGVDWQVGGFLDGNPDALRPFGIDLPIVGNPGSYEPQPDDCFTCAIGDPATKLHLCRSLQQRGGEFINLIHPTAMIGPRSRYGTGIICCPQSVITVDSVLGDFVTLNCRAGVGHDVVIGDGCTLNSYCDITGGAKLGEGVSVGSHAVVAPRTVVGDWAKVGAGSVVVRKVKPHSTVFGVPAARLDAFGETETRAA